MPVDTPGLPPQPDMPVPPELDYEKWLGPAPEAPYTEKRVHGRHDLASRPNWMRISDYANGMIANWGTHLNDIAQWANGSETSGPVEVGHRTVSISQLGLIAMELGGLLRWDPQRERFPDDNAANARLTRPQRDWRRAYGG